MTPRQASVLICAFFCGASARAQAFLPPRVVNTGIAGSQAAPCLAIDDPANPGVAANSIVFWEEIRGGPSYQLDQEGNRLDPVSANISGDFDVDSAPNLNDQYESDVAGDGKGKYVVVWTGETGDSEVFGRLFDGSTALGGQFQVNTNATGYQGYPSVARNANGDFVVVWQSEASGGDVSIQAQRFDASGTKVGSEFQVNTTPGVPASFQFNERPDVAISDNGDVFVVWKSPSVAVLGRLFPKTGTPTSETPIKPSTAGSQDEPAVAVNANGDYLVAWQEDVPGASLGAYGRRVDAAGAPQGTDFRINTPATATGAPRPDVAAAGDQFVAVWFSGGAGGQIFGRRIESNFRIVTREFEVTAFGAAGCPYPGLNCPNHARVAANSLGNVIAAWEEADNAPPGGPYTNLSQGIWGRRLELRAARLITINPPPAAPISVRAPQAADNGVIEPSETVAVQPTWKNTLEGTLALTGSGSDLQGPAGGTYTLDDTTADYGSIDEGESTDCVAATGNCYQVTISGSPRPATHWDATFLETLSNDLAKTWTLHVGESFTDVPVTHAFYKKIETLLHGGITAGCTPTTYCPSDQVSRGQMSLFVGRGIAGNPAAIPNEGNVGAKAYKCGAGGTSLFSDVKLTDLFCKSVHYIASQNVTLGCSGTEYCPNGNVTRLEMAAFMAKAIVAPAGGAGVPLTYGPDPLTGFSYSCDAASPSVFFTDVAASNAFCKHVHYLWARGVISGCGGSSYCPDQPVTRDAMAKFLSNAFELQLYGP